jgi:hypothetical protein
MSISNEFQAFVKHYASLGWEQPITVANLEVDGVSVPVHSFYAGHNSTHGFSICQEKNGPRYFRVSAGPRFTEASELTAEDLAYIEEIRKTRPYSCDDEIIMLDGKLIGLDKWTECVTVCSDLDTATNAYLGHF